MATKRIEAYAVEEGRAAGRRAARTEGRGLDAASAANLKEPGHDA